MKIAIILHRSKERTSAVEWWRVISPFKALEKKYGWQIDTFKEIGITDFDKLEGYDLVWFSYMDNILGFKELIDRNIKFVVDFDDDILNLGLFNPVRREYPPGSLAYRSILHIIQHAPHISVSTEHLKRVYGKLRRSTTDPVVLENRITPEAYLHFQPKKHINGAITIGWMGGSTHYADIFHTPFWGALCYLSGKYPRLTFSAMGLYQDADWSDLPNFTWLDGSSDHTTYTKLLNKWMNDVDIAVAPLEDNLFNASKSSIKCQEYGVYGRPVVASSVRPYQEFNADSNGCIRLAETHREWVEQLEALITNRMVREKEGKQLATFLNSYTIDSVVENYKNYIESVVNGTSYSVPARERLKKGRLHILLAVRQFKTITGSELYYYELAREYVAMGHQVTIVAGKIGNPLVSKANQVGADVISLDELVTITPDICIGSHEIMAEVSQTFTCPMIQVVHSENEYLWEIEKPIVGMDHYVAIRETIREKIIKTGIHPDSVTTIWNPIDLSRFKPITTKDKGSLLFVGPDDTLRRKVIKDLYRVATKKNMEVELIGAGQPKPPVWEIEEYINRCDMTASIYMGRTTLEGWAAGKACLIYDVDEKGNILSKRIVAPQPIEKFDSKKVAQKLLDLV